MKRLARLAAPLALTVALAGCGLQPMYAGGGSGAVARGLAAVEVAPIEGQAGWLVRNALLDDDLEGLGLLTDETVGRERRTLRARYQLLDLASGEIVIDATAGSDAGIDVVSSEFATIAAEQTALENLAVEVADRIVTRLTLALRAQS